MSNINLFRYLIFSIIGILIINNDIKASDSITIFTPFSKISVPPGESVDYNIDVINNGNSPQNLDISISGMPKDWNYILKSGGWNIQQLYLLPNERRNLSLKVDIPLKVNKGNYRFRVNAGHKWSLPLTINVSKAGTFKTEFNAEQSNMQGSSSSVFTYTANLKNLTADKQLYSLTANAPMGWVVTFKAKYKQVTSVDIEPNASENITIEINPPDFIEAGTYKIPVRAATSTTAADITLEAVITGTYNMELTTPSGLLSSSITTGEEKRVELVIKNTGSAELTNITLSFSAPVNWDVIFDPKKIDKLEAGKTAQVFATIKSNKKSIPGDYMVNIEARTNEISSKITFRMAVKTPMLWGWIGVLIILIALGSVYYLFRKYGRR
jgi:uncharacterized membrane protein